VVQVNWSVRAKRSLRDIYDYIADDNPAAADRVIRGILKKSQMLGQLPYIGQACRIEGFEHLRILVHGHYKIFYEVEESQITIAGVFHGRMDVKRHLRGE